MTTRPWIFRALLCGLVAAVSSSASDTATKRSMDPVEITRPWLALWSSYDLDQVDRLFLRSETLTYFSSEKEGLIRGIDAVREHHRGFGFVPGGKPSDSKLWLGGLEADSFGEAVLVAGIWYFQSGSEPPQRGPVTFVYVRAGDEYRLAHLHFANYEDSPGAESQGSWR